MSQTTHTHTTSLQHCAPHTHSVHFLEELCPVLLSIGPEESGLLPGLSHLRSILMGRLVEEELSLTKHIKTHTNSGETIIACAGVSPFHHVHYYQSADRPWAVLG